MTYPTELLQSIFSLKNGLELILTFVIMAQLAYMLFKMQRSKIFWSHVTFLSLLLLHFILLNAYSYFQIVLFQPYLFYPIYGSVLMLSYELISKGLVTGRAIWLNGLITGLGLVFYFTFPLEYHLNSLHLVVVIGYLLWQMQSEVTNDISRWYKRLCYFMIFLVGIFPLIYLFLSMENYLKFKIPYAVVFLVFVSQNFLAFLGKPKFFISKASPATTNFYDPVLQKIKLALEAQGLYRKTSLTISDFSKEINEPIYKISKTLNQHYAKSFPELVNSFRVHEVKNRLLEPQDANLTIEALAFEAGFNTPSSFYVAFKKELGLTPKQYKRQHLQAV